MDKYVKDSDIYGIVMSQFCASSDETEAALNAIIEGTRALPPAAVRPVVMCRDCRYFPDGDGMPEKLKWPEIDKFPYTLDYPCPCYDYDPFMSFKPEPDFYCAHGKRKDV